MFRRSSYAEVAAGHGGQQSQNSGLDRHRRGFLSHLSGSTSGSAGMLPSYPSRNFSRSLDADGHGSFPSHFNAPPWGRSSHTPSFTPQFGAYRDPPLDDAPPPAFFVPSYLRGSRYAEKLEEAHQAKQASQRELRSQQFSHGTPLSTTSGSANLHRTGPARALTLDIIERAPPLIDEPLAPWPTRWNEHDKYSQLELEDDDRVVRYMHKGQDDAATVRADYPMPRQCGIYYYEITVMSKHKPPSRGLEDQHMIGVGFCSLKVALTRIPGWEPESYAYHSDDGQIFTNTTSGKNYGPNYQTLDVVGCGVNFRTGTAFFTRNGCYLGTAFKDLPRDKLFYPTVGMKKVGEWIKANFGQEPFAFDIDKMVQAEKAAIRAEMANHIPVSPSTPDGADFDEAAFIHDLVAQYLTHDGYVETARAFSEEVDQESRALDDGGRRSPYVPPEEDVDAINRQKIRSAILEGDIDKAIKYANAYYPTVLSSNENIYFKLKCRKFIEMIRRANELHAMQREAATPRSKRSTASSGLNDDYDFDMDLDEQNGVQQQFSFGSVGNTEGEHMDTEDELDELDADELKERRKHLTEETIQYGMDLKRDFAGDPRREVKRALEDTFALIAYEIPAASSLAPLLDKAGRGPVAEELNSAILVSLGKCSTASLERLTQQTEVLVDMLAENGGDGAFINVKGDFLRGSGSSKEY